MSDTYCPKDNKVRSNRKLSIILVGCFCGNGGWQIWICRFRVISII